MNQIDFNDLLMHWMLSFLLFAGALHVNLADLRSYRWPIGLLATFGVLIATLVIGYLAHWVFSMFGWNVPLIYCLLFGALISPPTRSPYSAHCVPPMPPSHSRLRSWASRCSMTARRWWYSPSCWASSSSARRQALPTPPCCSPEAIGGIAFGGVIGYATYRMIKSVEQYRSR